MENQWGSRWFFFCIQDLEDGEHMITGGDFLFQPHREFRRGMGQVDRGALRRSVHVVETAVHWPGQCGYHRQMIPGQD